MENDEVKTEETLTDADIEVLDAPVETDAYAAEHDKYLRLAAEYANYKNRTTAESVSRYNDGKAEVVRAILPVWDNFDRALKQETIDKQGVELIMRQLNEVFDRLGISAIVAEPGIAFDPELHDAILHVEDESLSANVVAEELIRGFKLGDKVLRHSKVKAAN